MQLSVWYCISSFACRISRTNCCHWNVVEFSMNSKWINEEVKWQLVSNFAGNSSFDNALWYCCLLCNLVFSV
jgi:hypothetical protein